MENIPSNLNWAKGLLLGVLIIGSILISFFGVLLIGSYIGEMFNPITTHACVCDEPPTLSDSQSLIIGGFYTTVLMAGLYYVLSSFDLTRIMRKILLLILFLINGTFCIIALDILSSEVSG